MDTSTDSGIATGTGIATLVDVVQQARRKAESIGTQSDVIKWLIIAAAIFGALMLMLGMRSVMRFAFGFFWLWFWTHGAWRWIF